MDNSQTQPAPESVDQIPQQPSMSQEAINRGVQVRQVEFTEKVVDENNKPLTSSPATTDVTIEIPAEKSVLETLAKGSEESAVTWFASFWLRMLRKAAHFGWGVVSRKS
ncbi:hypothetical protein ACFL2C_01810 [Patescibacteria group bacterium]